MNYKYLAWILCSGTFYNRLIYIGALEPHSPCLRNWLTMNDALALFDVDITCHFDLLMMIKQACMLGCVSSSVEQPKCKKLDLARPETSSVLVECGHRQRIPESLLSWKRNEPHFAVGTPLTSSEFGAPKTMVILNELFNRTASRWPFPLRHIHGHLYNRPVRMATRVSPPKKIQFASASSVWTADISCRCVSTRSLKPTSRGS